LRFFNVDGTDGVALSSCMCRVTRRLKFGIFEVKLRIFEVKFGIFEVKFEIFEVKFGIFEIRFKI
jgi:hypothetical protein